jgi:hypothetical protein
MAEEKSKTLTPHNADDDDSVLDRGNYRNGEHESEEIVDETMNEPTPRRQTQSQDKTKPFNIPKAELSRMIRRMNQHKARSKYFRRFQDLFPEYPRTRKAM